MSDALTIYDLIGTAKQSFADWRGANPGADEDAQRDALDDAIADALPWHNGSIALILAADLRLGFPDDRSIMEAGDIFAAIRGSIRETMFDELEALISADQDCDA